MSISQPKHEYVDEWVDNPSKIIEKTGIDENSEVAATGMPRAWFMSHKDNEASSADKVISNILFQYGEDADVKAYRENDEINVERALGEPKWRFPSGRKGRNENLVVAEGPDTSVMDSVVRDPDVHVFADAASYTGHEQGHEHRKSEEPYGRVEEILSEDLGADTGLVTIKNFPYFNDIAASERDEADFSEYVTRVGDQVDDLYDQATVVGESYDPSEMASDDDPGIVYVLGEGRE